MKFSSEIVSIDVRLAHIYEQSCLSIGSRQGKGRIRKLWRLADKQQEEAMRLERNSHGV